MDARLMELCSVLVREEEVRGKRVLDVGSYDINGSFRTVLEPMHPSLYLGVDMESGKGVDMVVNVHDLSTTFEANSFDIVISTEAIEHIEDWRSAVNQIKGMVKVGGMLLLTSRSLGFGYHAYPDDHWRYELNDIRDIFPPESWGIEVLTEDMYRGDHYGFFLKAWKKNNFVNDLSGIALYHIKTDRRMHLNNSLHIEGITGERKPRRITSTSDLTELEQHPPFDYWI
mgnify:CR=1 FL=1